MARARSAVPAGHHTVTPQLASTTRRRPIDWYKKALGADEVARARSPAGWLEERTGTLLARVLAHEIGHYLLGPGHTEAGLMRAQFEFRDLWTDRPDAYSLTDHAPEFVSSSSLPLRSRAAPRSDPTRR